MVLDGGGAGARDGKARPMDGRALVHMRAYRDMSQKKLGDLTGVDRRAISNIEKGKAVMSPEERVVIARALRVPAFLFEDTSEFLGYVDHATGEGTMWSGTLYGGMPEVDVTAGETRESTAGTRRLLRYEKHVRIAEAVGRAVKTFILGLLEAVSGGTYDDY